MVRIKEPLESEDARGAFGPGAVFGKWKGTNWVRARFRTPQVKSMAETRAKSELAKYASMWGELTAGQKSAWNTYSGTVTRYDSMGNPYHVSGQCEYIGINCRCALLGLAYRADPPDQEPPLISDYSWAEYDPFEGIPRFKIYALWLATHNPLQYFVSRPKSQGQVGYPRESSYEGIIEWPINYEWFYVPAAGYTYQIRHRTIDDQGQAGPWLSYLVTATE